MIYQILGVFIDVSILAVFMAAVWTPFFFMKRCKYLIVAFFLSLVTMSALTIFFYWWRSYSIDLELWWLGYDSLDFDFEDRTRDVPEGLKEYAENLNNSPTQNIGWPVRAGFGVVFLVFPYLIVTFVTSWICRKIKSRKVTIHG